jgi:hypothetical protein
MLILTRPNYPGYPDNNKANDYMPQRFIKILLCHKFEVEINVVKINNQFLINIVVTPSIEILYRKSNGNTWKFETFEDAWDFIDAHQEFDLRIILIELEKQYSTLRHEFKKSEEYLHLHHMTMNAREALGVYRVYDEIVQKNAACSLRLYAKFKYCQDTFGGYGYHYRLTYYQGTVIDNISFSPAEIAKFVDLNMTISKIIKALNLDVLIDISNSVKYKLSTAEITDNLEIMIGRQNRIEYLNSFIEYLETFI